MLWPNGRVRLRGAPWVLSVSLALSIQGCGRLSYDPLSENDAADLDAAGLEDAMPGSRDAPGLDVLSDAPPVDSSIPCALAPIRLSATITNNNDDGGVIGDVYQRDGEPPYPTRGFPAALWIGYYEGAVQWGFFRFALPATIPAGSTIVAASLELWGLATTEWDPVGRMDALVVMLQAARDPAQVITGADAPERPTGVPVGAQLRWPPSGGLEWPIDGYNATPDLSALLQERLDAEGSLDASTHLQFWLRHERVVTPQGPQVATGDLATSAQVARLSIDYCPP